MVVQRAPIGGIIRQHRVQEVLISFRFNGRDRDGILAGDHGND
jgi:hypothetical protein